MVGGPGRGPPRRGRFARLKWLKDMKILSISTDRKIFEEGSAVRARQVEYAKAPGCEELHIVVFTPRKNCKGADWTEFRESSITSNCFVYPTHSWSRFLYPFDAARLGKFIAKGRGITNITCQDASLTAMAGLSIKRFAKKVLGRNLPIEMQIHADIGSPYFAHNLGNRIRKSLSLSFLPKADTIRVVSERIKKYLVTTLKIAPEKITVRPIAVDTAEISAAPITADLHKKYPQFEKIVLMASRLTTEKNIALAIESWPAVLAKNPRAGLVIVGSGPHEARLKNLAKVECPQGGIVFESWADRKTLFSYYKTCDAFLNTSLFEGYGMTLVEAKAAGAKVISTDVGVAPEIGARLVAPNRTSVADGILETLRV